MGPIVYVVLGSDAGPAGAFELFRPYFLAAAGLFLGQGFYGVHADPTEACLDSGECETLDEARRRRSRQTTMLWVSTALVVLFATFPTWSAWLT